jgi:hypothetical protein
LCRSPGTRRKNKAPPPPPSTFSQQTQIEQNSPEQTSNQYSTGNRSKLNKEEKGTQIITSKSVEESSPSSSSNQIKNIYKRFTRGFSFSLALTVR